MTADSVMAQCQALGVRTMGLEVDLTDRAATEKYMAEIAAELGSCDSALFKKMSDDHYSLTESLIAQRRNLACFEPMLTPSINRDRGRPRTSDLGTRDPRPIRHVRVHEAPKPSTLGIAPQP